MTLKTIGHLFYAALCVVHNFVAIRDFKLELQSRNTQFGSKSAIFCPTRTWNVRDDNEKQQGTSHNQLQALHIVSWPLVYSNCSCSPGMTKSGQNWQFFVRRDLYTWRITLTNNRAPLITYFELCASFRSHWWIQTGVTVRKWPIWVKMEFFPPWHWR